MKILKIILVLVACICISCKKTDSKNEHIALTKKNSKDTYVVEEENCIVSFKWNQDEPDTYKTSFNKEDDFYVVMDDVNYYTAEARECFKNFGLKELVIDKKEYNYIKLSDDFLIKLDSLKFFEQILIQKNKKHKVLKPVDLLTECENLSSVSQNSMASNIKSYDEFTPKNYSILTKLEYDWNEDRIKDMIIVYDSIPSNKGEAIGKRPLIALLGKSNNHYEFWFRNDNAIPCRSCSGSADPDIELKIYNGKLYYKDVSLMGSTVKNIKYTFDKNLDLISIDLEVEQIGEETKKERILGSNLPKVGLRNINLKKIENLFFE